MERKHLMSNTQPDSSNITNNPDQKDPNPKKKKSWVGVAIFAAVCFLVFIIGLSSWITSPKTPDNDIQTRNATWTDVGFDTPVMFQATCSESDFVKYTDIVREVFINNNRLFDQYNPYDGVNNIYLLNLEAADHPIEVDDRIIQAIERSMDVHKLVDSYDITEGKLLSLWHDFRESDDPIVPDADTIAKAKEHTGMEGVLVDGNMVSFADDTIQLDLGAIAKGQTAQEAKEALEKAGLDNGYINAGGNAVLIGNKPDGTAWRVGIQNPDDSGSLVVYETETPTCLVTSGDYQRYVVVDGKCYSHIIDPHTGYPAQYVRSVTVINEDSTWADAMSTALFCMSVEDGMKLCEEQNLEAVWFAEKGSCSLTPDLETDDFDIYCTPGVKDSITLAN